MLNKLDLVGQKYVEVSWIWSVKLYVKSTEFGRVKPVKVNWFYR